MQITGASLTGCTLNNPLNCDPNYNNVVLLLPMNGANGSTTFTDYSSSPKAVTVNGGAQISTTTYQWNGSSGYFNGTDAWLSVPTSVFTFGTNDFTLEFWLNIANPAVQTWPYTMASSVWSSGGGFYMVIKGTGTGWGGAGLISFNGAADLTYGPGVESTTAIRGAGWKYVAVTRQGVTTRLFINGILESTHTAAGIANYSAPYARIMRSYSPSNAPEYEKGYINDLRVTIGTARYTSNFTAPTEPFPTIGC